MKAITVRQPWAWAIMHGGKAARLIAFCLREGRIGTCPVSESQDTPSTLRRASADGSRTKSRNAPFALTTLPISLIAALPMSSHARTAGWSGRRGKCLDPSRASVNPARPLGPEHGPKRTPTNGSVTAADRGSSRSTASPRKSTTSGWPLKGTCARYVGIRRPTLAGTGCMLTTVTTQGASEEFFAGRATRASVALATVSSGFALRSTTWSPLSPEMIGGAPCAS